jgi:hypothetical protein
MSINCLPAALDLASRGYRVFPCVPGAKNPLTPHGFKDGSSDPATIVAWWEANPRANVAIATDGLVVIDVDVDAEKGRPDNPWLAEHPDRLAELEAAPHASTPRGGRHYIFRQDGDQVRCSVDQLAPHVDVRADGGYLLVAPSRTECGEYVFLNPLPPTVADLPTVPEWLATALELTAKAEPKAARSSTARFHEGNRNAQLASVAGSLRRRGFEAPEILARLERVNAERCVPPLSSKEVASIAESIGKYPAGASAPIDDLSEIEILPDEHRVNDEVVRCLVGDGEIYQRGGRLVRVVRRCEGARGDGGLMIQEVEQPTLREVITRRVRLVKEIKEEIRPVHPPAWMVAGVHSRGYWHGIRSLHAVAESPVLRPDGTVVEQPGYDAVTGVLYQPVVEFPTLPTGANKDDADAALDELSNVLCDFEFESPVHLSGMLALILTTVGRHAFEGPAPVFLIDANSAGAGKSLLAKVVSVIAFGHEVAATSYNHDSDELRKQISMTALEGEPFVVFDNLRGVFGNDTLDRALTTVRWRDRRLGTNSKVDAPLVTTFAATGNNVAIEADTARRTVHIRLNVLAERPEDRDGFKHPDLLAYVRANRQKLFMAALTVLSVYLREGCPAVPLRPMGSFEGWSRLIRGALVWCGRLDPCLGRDGLVVMSDSGADAGQSLIDAWRRYDPLNQGLVVADLLQKLYPATAAQPMDGPSVAMRAAIEQFVGGNANPPATRAVGNKLRAIRQRVFGGHFLVCDAKSSRGKVWRLRAVDGAPVMTLVSDGDASADRGGDAIDGSTAA